MRASHSLNSMEPLGRANKPRPFPDSPRTDSLRELPLRGRCAPCTGDCGGIHQRCVPTPVRTFSSIRRSGSLRAQHQRFVGIRQGFLYADSLWSARRSGSCAPCAGTAGDSPRFALCRLPPEALGLLPLQTKDLVMAFGQRHPDRAKSLQSMVIVGVDRKTIQNHRNRVDLAGPRESSG